MRPYYLCPGPCLWYLPGLHWTPKRLGRVWNKSQKCVVCNWMNSFKLHCSLISTVTSAAKYMTYLNSSQSNKLRYNLFRKAFVVTWSPNWPLTGRGENCASSWKRSYQSMLRLCMLFLLPFPTQRGVRIRIVLTYSCWDQTSRRNGLNRRIDPSNCKRILHTWFQTRWRRVCHSPDRLYR